MKLLDANILIYAYNPGLPEHTRARQWLETALSEPGLVGMAWITILAFLRITTNPRSFREAYSVAEATDIVTSLFGRPNVVLVEPRGRHWEILRNMMVKAQARADLAMDAHLAALATEHGAVLCTNDRDFARFPGIRILNPLED